MIPSGSPVRPHEVEVGDVDVGDGDVGGGGVGEGRGVREGMGAEKGIWTTMSLVKLSPGDVPDVAGELRDEEEVSLGS